MATCNQETKRPLIIGGGVAGLAAAIRMTEWGVSPVVIEMSAFPSHKVCGEFFSPEVIPLLSKWGLAPPTRIHDIEIYGLNRSCLHLPLTKPAASQARYQFDASLANYAVRCGVTLRTQTTVRSILPPADADGWKICLDHGEMLSTQTLLIGVGRLLHQFLDIPIPSFPYVGFKTHVESDNIPGILQMHCVKGGYWGMCPIGDGRFNVAMLLRRAFNQDPSALLNRQLGPVKLCFDWMRTQVPPFGVRSIPHMQGLYPIGDAAAAIPPISGQGLSMGLTSGILAAEYAIRGDPIGYRSAWKHNYLSRMRWALALHALLTSKEPIRHALCLAPLFSPVVRFLYHRMRTSLD